ncbi:hypothetical protein LTR16_000565 [Cryomyces antarcticus]|uniref:Uncharacterized protein n=1 Tax=Cryomyces antarcticus TaxID=329879 RepID=A0ABR0LQY5_9PEZI|nr:hypothetical protein LTR16_000565 [Cryomyces antarcticus]
MGGVIEVDGEYLGMTVSHLFDELPPTISPSSSLSLDFDENDLDLHIIDVQAQSEHPIDYDEMEELMKTGSLAFSKQTMGVRLGVLKALSTDPVRGYRPRTRDLDWALDKSQHEVISNSVAYGKIGEGCTVYLATGTRGVISGLSINCSSTLRITESMLDVWVIQLNEIKPGDCGSWVFGTNGELLGMLIGTCVALREAYLAPACDILDDIRRTGRSARMPFEDIMERDFLEPLAEPNMPDSRTMAPLAKYQLRDLIRFQYGYSSSPEHMTPKKHQHNSSSSVLDYSGATFSDGFPRLMDWVRTMSDSEIVQHLQTKVILADLPESERRQLLLWAVEAGREKTVELLLEEGFADAKSGTLSQRLLCIAADNGHVTLVELLHARDDIDVNLKDRPRNTPLHYAAMAEQEAVVKLLLARDDVDVNSKNLSGNTPLHYAAVAKQEAVAKLLLARDDIDVNSKDHSGNTPLHHAAMAEQDSLVKLLLARDGIRVNSKDHSGNTPLHYAARAGQEAIAKLLLARDDIDIYPKDRSGNTPLYHAARAGKDAVVKLLLARDDIDVNLGNSLGHKPLSIAGGNGHEAIVSLLQGMKPYGKESLGSEVMEKSPPCREDDVMYSHYT